MSISLDQLDADEKQRLLDALLAERDRPGTERMLSFAQERLWFLDRFQPGLSVYNLPLTLLFPGPLDAEALRRALGEVVRRHAILRTVFRTVDGEPRQLVRPPTGFALPLIDLAAIAPAAREEEAQRLAAAEARHIFDLAEGPLFRATLVRTAADRHLLLLNMHHIVSDGWSTGILVREIGSLYQAYAAGAASPLAEPAMQYADFAEQQRARLSGASLERHLAYWRAQLSDAPPVLDLPADRPRPQVQSFNGAWQSFVLDAALVSALRRIASQAGATLFMVLLAAFKVLLFRYSNAGDVVVGTPIANRNRSEIEELIGFFVNTLVLRSRISGALRFDALLAAVRDATLDAYAHQDLPFEKLVEEMQPERNLSHNPLFQVMFTLQNLPGAAAAPPAEGGVFLGTSKFDLTWALAEAGGQLGGTCEYSTDLFDHDRIARMIGHYRTLLTAIARDPSVRISEAPLLTDAEADDLRGWSGSDTGYPATSHVLAPFERHVAAAPEAEALSFRGERLSYGALDALARRLARALAARGIASGARVAVCMERSIELVVAILGIVKAGGTYVPVDPAYPRELLGAMLADTRCRVVLTHQPTIDRIPQGDWEAIAIDATLSGVPDGAAADPEPLSLAADLAIFFSSGSTGRPKASLLRAEGFWNAFQWFGRIARLGPGSRLLLMTPHAFDASFKSILAPLLFGGTLVLAEPGPFDPQAVLETIEREQVDTSFITPSGLYALLERAAADDYRGLAGLRMLFFGGEASDARRLRDWAGSRDFGCALVHIYGPSECSDVTTYQPVAREAIERAAAIPIGAPVDNVRHYVLDPFGNPQPVGIAGELHLGGFMLATGYVGNPSATAARFVPDPSAIGARLYRTGDLVRRDATGAISFLGRLDRQVKVRGMRVEPDGVARVLEGHPAVREAVVTVHAGQDGDARLVGYVVAAPEASPAPEELRSYVRGKLPPHMVPAAIVVLAAFPLSPNGKFDWQAFPEPVDQPEATEWTGPAPETALEQTLAGIWCEVLGLAAVGIHADLFELGGHSLLATQIISRVNSAFDVDIPIRTLFEAPTIASFAAAIRALEPEKRLDEYAELLLHVASLSAQDVVGELQRLAGPGGDP